jgi:hypothetical protein
MEKLGFTYAVRAAKNFSQDAAAQKEGGGRILLKRAGSDGMASRILSQILIFGELPKRKRSLMPYAYYKSLSIKILGKAMRQQTAQLHQCLLRLVH